MKKLALLLSVPALGFLLSSYENGAANNGLGNRTGSNGGAACNGGGCHAASSSATSASFVEIKNKVTNVVTTSTYEPGQTYVVTFTGSHASLTKWGFQVIALSNTTASPIGNMTATMTNTQVPSSDPSIVEHSNVLSASGGQFNGSFEWIAPPTGSGPVKFFGIINAVNNNGNVGGDTPSLTFNSNTLTESTTSVGGTQSGNRALRMWPNPVVNQLQIMTGVEGGSFLITDISGRKIFTSEANLTATQVTTVSTSNWPAGIYLAHFVKGGTSTTQMIVRSN